MNTIDFSLVIALMILIAIRIQCLNKSDRYILLKSDKFWKLALSQEKPIVLLTTKGKLIKRLCYVFPYQGVLFFTDARNTEAPAGINLIGTGDSFSLR